MIRSNFENCFRSEACEMTPTAVPKLVKYPTRENKAEEALPSSDMDSLNCWFDHC